MAKTKTTKKSPARKTTRSAKSAPKKTPARKTASAKPAISGKNKKLSAIDAAVRVLGAAKEPMTTQQIIDAMRSQKLWTSPGGKTPERTLYSAILREIATKGKDARFKKSERGKFVLKG